MGWFVGRLGDGVSYPLLGELAGTLVLGVAEEFDNAALVGGESGGGV